jgi:prepilin-type processing-associated H-X9-DG protein
VTEDHIRADGSFGWGGGYGVHSLQTFRYDEYQNPFAAPRRRGGPRITRVKPATKVWLVGDTGRPAGHSGTWMTWVGTYSPPFNRSGHGANTNQPACRHPRDSANVGFFDGHVEPVPFSELNDTSKPHFPTAQQADRF